MGLYIIIGGNASTEEQERIAKVNAAGGVGAVSKRALNMMRASLAIVVVAIVLPKALSLLALAGGGLLMIVARLYVWRATTTSSESVLTADPVLMELDRAWLKKAAADPDAMWGLVLNQQRFATLRRLTRLPMAEAAPLIIEAYRSIGLVPLVKVPVQKAQPSKPTQAESS